MLFALEAVNNYYKNGKTMSILIFFFYFASIPVAVSSQQQALRVNIVFFFFFFFPAVYFCWCVLSRFLCIIALE